MSTSYFLGELEKAEAVQLSGWGENQHCAGLQQSSTQSKSYSPHSENRSEIFRMDFLENGKILVRMITDK